MMSQPQKIHLFNCDHIYDLDIIADLINATKAKLGFDVTVENHYFSLPRMSELSEKIIPGLQMDFAVFVAHAHESRLSINEDDRGYTKVYRALLQATGKKSIDRNTAMFLTVILQSKLQSDRPTCRY